MSGTRQIAPPPAPQQQVQAPQQTIQAPQQPVQAQAPQFSDVETLLQNIEAVSATLPAHQGDVAQAKDALGTKKADKRDIWRRITFGWFGKKRVARLSKEERTRTRSDVRRTDIKARLAAIAQNFAEHPQVQNDPAFQAILMEIEGYSKLDVTGVSEKDQEKGERRLFQKICDDLDKYVGNAAFQGTEVIGRMAANLKIFFDAQRNGNLSVPAAGRDVYIIEDKMRPPTLVREVTAEVTERDEKKEVSVYVEDESSRGKVEFKKMKKEPLFPHEPSINDIRQGSLGDCYLLAALASIVNRNPQAIKDCMRDNGDGTVYVRFFATKIDHNVSVFQPMYVHVDKAIPRYDKKKDPFARGSLWVQLMERAYAIIRSRLLGRDRYANNVWWATGARDGAMRKYNRIKRELDQQPNEEAKKKYLDEVKRDPRNLYMFDEQGNFYSRANQISFAPSYADLPGGHAYDVFKHLLGTKSTFIYQQEQASMSTKSWISSYAVHNLQQLHHKVQEGDQGAPNGQNVQNDGYVPKDNFGIMAETLLSLLKNDPQTAGRNWDLADINSYKTEIENWRKQMVDSCDRIMQNAQNDPALRSARGKRDRIRNELDILFSGFTSQQVDANTDKHTLILQKLYLVLQRMTEGLTTAKQTNLVGAYSPEEETKFWEIKGYIDQGKGVVASSRDMKGAKTGLNGEGVTNGIAETHAYTVLGVEQREINLGHGKVGLCKFVKVRNPWGSGAVSYSVQGGKLVSSMHESSKQGVCLVEFREFLMRFKGISVSDS